MQPRRPLVVGVPIWVGASGQRSSPSILAGYLAVPSCAQVVQNDPIANSLEMFLAPTPPGVYNSRLRLVVNGYTRARGKPES